MIYPSTKITGGVVLRACFFYLFVTISVLQAYRRPKSTEHLRTFKKILRGAHERSWSKSGLRGRTYSDLADFNQPVLGDGPGILCYFPMRISVLHYCRVSEVLSVTIEINRNFAIDFSADSLVIQLRIISFWFDCCSIHPFLITPNMGVCTYLTTVNITGFHQITPI